jgi:hypothetical protein
VSVDPRFERYVLAELALRERRARRRDGSHGARVLAQRLQHGRDDLLAHLRRVVQAVPRRFRRVAWLHHAHEADVTPQALSTVGPTKEEMSALELLAAAGSSSRARPPGPYAHAVEGARFGWLSRARCRARGDRGPFGRGTARRRDADLALSPSQSTAGDVNRCRVIAAARVCVTNGSGPRRRDHAGLVGQRLVTAWARVATIERGPNDVARHGAARADHVGHAMQARSRQWPHQVSRSVRAIRATDGGEDPS